MTENAKLHHDAAQTLPERDEFGFHALADQLRQNIVALLEGERAGGGFTLGLEGRWGSGKSTILNYLRLSLKAVLNPKTQFLLDFDPWWLEEDANIVSALLSAVLDAMPKDEAGKAAAAIGKLAGAAGNLPEGLDVLFSLSKKSEGIGKLVKAARETGGDLGKLLNASKPARKLRDEVAETFTAKGFTFIVLIDDLDRLAPEQAIRVMSAIKSIADLPGFVYVLAYDPAALGNILKSFKPPLGTDYFEKIINVSVPVPPVTASQVNGFVSGLLNPAFRDALQTSNAHKAALIRLLDAPRDAIRLANSVNFWGGSKTNELYLPDFILLEAIRQARPAAYTGVLQTSDIWLNTESSDLLGRVLGNTDAAKEATRQEMADLIAATFELGDGPRDKAVRGALSVLFPKAAEYLGRTAGFDEFVEHRPDTPRAISDSGHFFTYFLHRPLPGSPSREEVNTLISPDATSDQRLDLISQISRRPLGDVSPLHHLIALLDAERDDGNIRNEVLFELMAGLVSPSTYRNPQERGNSLGSDQSAVRGFVARSMEALKTLTDDQVGALTADSLDLEIRGAMQVLLTAGTEHYLLEGGREERLAVVSDAVLMRVTAEFVDRVLAGLADDTLFAVSTAPTLMFMARRYDTARFDDVIRSVFSDNRRTIALVESYQGYTNSWKALREFSNLDDHALTERLAAAFAEEGRPVPSFSSW